MPKNTEPALSQPEQISYIPATSVLGDHGGFAYDDINVKLMVAHLGLASITAMAALPSMST
jgi:hypothetical protein